MFDGTTTGAAYDGFRDRVLGVTFYPGIPVESDAVVDDPKQS